MHYKDGSQARVGDIVKGPGPSGHDIIGKVVSLSSGPTCNMRVACVHKHTHVLLSAWVSEPVVHPPGTDGQRASPYDVASEPSIVLADLAYLSTKDFEKIA